MGRLLLDAGRIKPEDAERVLRVQKEKGLRFGEAAKSLGLITDQDITEVLAHQFDYGYYPTGSIGASPELFVASRPFSPSAEVLRSVRSQLMLRWFMQGRKALVIAGIDCPDGASLLAANLAIGFSQLGEATLLIDSNLRTPAQHRIFGLPENILGFSDVLAGRSDASAILNQQDFNQLSILPSGTVPPNPLELMNRPAFAQIKQHALTNYDVVLVDAPPIVKTADAMVMAANWDGVLLVARKDHTSMRNTKTFIEQLKHNNVEVVGTVLVDF